MADITYENEVYCPVSSCQSDVFCTPGEAIRDMAKRASVVAFDYCCIIQAEGQENPFADNEEIELASEDERHPKHELAKSLIDAIRAWILGGFKSDPNEWNKSTYTWDGFVRVSSAQC
jgi:hypothetical protein